MWYSVRVRDFEIEQLEDDLRRSQFAKWDVETLLADRHRAKIEALTRPQPKWAHRWQVTKQIGQYLLSYVGAIALLALSGHWFLTGQFLP